MYEYVLMSRHLGIWDRKKKEETTPKKVERVGKTSGNMG